MILDTQHALSRLANTPPAVGPPTTFSEDFWAFYEQPTQEYDTRLGEAYQSYIDRQKEATGVELHNPLTDTEAFMREALGREPSWFDKWLNAPSTATLEALFREEAKARYDKGELLELPGDMHEAAKGMAQTRADYQAWVMARGEQGWFDRPGQMAGALAGGVTDPIILGTTLVTLPFAAAQTLRGAIALEAAIGGVTEAAIQPFIAEQREKLGQPYTIGEGIMAVGAGTLLGGVFGATAHGTATGLRHLLNTYEQGKAAKLARLRHAAPAPETEDVTPPASPLRLPETPDAPPVRMTEDAARVVVEAEQHTQEAMAAVAVTPAQQRAGFARLAEVEQALAHGEPIPHPPPATHEASPFVTDYLERVRHPEHRAAEPPSLTAFIAREGGIQPGTAVETPEVQRLLRDDGVPLEQLAERAHAAGLFPERPQPADVIAALRQEEDRIAGLASQRVADTQMERMLRDVGLTPEDAAAMRDVDVEKRLFPDEPAAAPPVADRPGPTHVARMVEDAPPMTDSQVLADAEALEAMYLEEARAAGDNYLLVDYDEEGRAVIGVNEVPVAEIERVIDEERTFLDELKLCAGQGTPAPEKGEA